MGWGWGDPRRGGVTQQSQKSDSHPPSRLPSQYPGVAQSIQSDVQNLLAVLKMSVALPEGEAGPGAWGCWGVGGSSPPGAGAGVNA